MTEVTQITRTTLNWHRGSLSVVETLSFTAQNSYGQHTLGDRPRHRILVWPQLILPGITFTSQLHEPNDPERIYPTLDSFLLYPTQRRARQHSVTPTNLIEGHVSR